MSDINDLKRIFPPGTRVMLEYMDDKQAPPPGTTGTVQTIDDIGTIHVNWDNGSSLGLIPRVDRFRRI